MRSITPLPTTSRGPLYWLTLIFHALQESWSGHNEVSFTKYGQGKSKQQGKDRRYFLWVLHEQPLAQGVLNWPKKTFRVWYYVHHWWLWLAPGRGLKLRLIDFRRSIDTDFFNYFNEDLPLAFRTESAPMMPSATSMLSSLMSCGSGGLSSWMFLKLRTVLSLISHNTEKRADFIRWQFKVCFRAWRESIFGFQTRFSIWSKQNNLTHHN